MSEQQQVEISKLSEYLNKKNSLELLQKYTEFGYKNSKGLLTIKDGSVLYKLFRVLNGDSTDSEYSEADAYTIIFKALDAASSVGAFTLSDSAIIDNVVDWIRKNVLVEAPVAEEPVTAVTPTPVSSIQEIEEPVVPDVSPSNPHPVSAPPSVTKIINKPIERIKEF